MPMPCCHHLLSRMCFWLSSHSLQPSGNFHTMPEPTAPEIAAAAAEMQFSFDQQVGITILNPELLELKKP